MKMKHTHYNWQRLILFSVFVGAMMGVLLGILHEYIDLNLPSGISGIINGAIVGITLVLILNWIKQTGRDQWLLKKEVGA